MFEAAEYYWSKKMKIGGLFPADYGETVESTLVRELEEELGVPAKNISFDPKIAHYNLGSSVNGVPRMNLFLKA